MILHAKSSGDGGGGSSYHVKRPTITEKMYRCNLAILQYPNGKVEIAKNRYNGEIGDSVDVKKMVSIFSDIIAELHLKETQLNMFKEGLSNLLQDAIEKTLKGEYYERTICHEGIRHGSPSDRST